MSIACKIKTVKSNIEKAQSNSPDSALKVRLVAVTKTLGLEPIQEAYDAGVRDFGENRVQEILEKYPHLPSDIRWHLIGHLQTNKVKYIVDKIFMIHSLDSLHLAEVNIADEDTKFGLKEGEVEDFLKAMPRFSHIRIEGLMTIGPHVSDESRIRDVFHQLRGMSQNMSKLALPNVRMRELSMGMSGDYMTAVEEGSTMVRVGTSIFGPRF